MTDPIRVGPDEAHGKLQGGEKTLLVCAYDSDAGFRKYRIEGAIPLSELQSRLPSLSRDQEIVFY